MMTTLPFLTDAEINEICCPLVNKAAQIRYLRDQLKIKVLKKPNGRALVHRAEFERALVKSQNKAQDELITETKPNTSRLQALLGGKKNAKKETKQSS